MYKNIVGEWVQLYRRTFWGGKMRAWRENIQYAVYTNCNTHTVLFISRSISMTPLSTDYIPCHNMQLNDWPMMWFGMLFTHKNGLTLRQIIARFVAPTSCGAAAANCSLHRRRWWGGDVCDVLWLPPWPTLVCLQHRYFFLILSSQNGLALRLQRATSNMWQQAAKLLFLSPFPDFYHSYYYKCFFKLWAISLCDLISMLLWWQ